jgi:diadenosine tetraphosphate (Ap4A) HIT family hydrolase
MLSSPIKVTDRPKHVSEERGRSPVMDNEHFILEACSTCHIPGYLIVRPREAVDSLSRMNPAALAALRSTLAMTTAAIEEIVRPQRVYCALFSEKTGVVHFHLFPRTKWLTSKYFVAHPQETKISDPQLMDWARRVFQKPISGIDRDETWEKVRGWLRPAFSVRQKSSRAP